jgi:hypothetical protein
MLYTMDATYALRKRPQCEIQMRSAIEKVIPRTAIEIDSSYFVWASHFAVLSDVYLAQIASCPSEGRWENLNPSAGDCHRLNVGRTELQINYLQPVGWTIELVDGDFDDRHERILSVVRGDMPVLCPRFESATGLAEGSLTNPHYFLYWRPFHKANVHPRRASL